MRPRGLEGRHAVQIATPTYAYKKRQPARMTVQRQAINWELEASIWGTEAQEWAEATLAAVREAWDGTYVVRDA